MVEAYFFNYKSEELKEKGLVPIGMPGLLVSGAPIDNLPYFQGEISKTAKEANPNFPDIFYFSVSYKSNKKGLASKIERITFSTGGKVQKDQHFYIVQPLKEINQKP